MSGPGPTTMKTIQKRIYAALPRTVSSPTSCSSPVSIPRVRANSASSARSFYTAATSSLPNPSTLSIFDAPSSASGSRPATSPRLSLQPRCEAEGQSNSPSAPLGSPPFTIFHSSLQPNASLTTSHSAFPPLFSFSTNPFSVDSAHDLPHSSRKRHSPRYHLDIGAYGIPKSTNSTRVTGWDGCGQFLRPKHRENPNLAVQVGEDAYFVRDDAMGVADGVGGWSKVKSYGTLHTLLSSCPGLTASHIDVAFCGPFVSSPSAVFARHLMHFCSAEVENARSSSASRLKPNDARCLPRAHFAMQPGHHFTPSIDAHRRGSRPDEVLEDSEDPLESLEDGIDVLVILQRAYEKAMKAHVTPSKPNMTADPVEGVPAPSAYASSPVLSLTPSTPVPLLAGSSTALLAVLDQSLSHSELSTVEPSLGSKATYDAVIKIAHIGDCMGMLIRGDEITWRSEEMWWSVRLVVLSIRFVNPLPVPSVQYPGPTWPIILCHATGRACVHPSGASR
jgi:hypothetical protein